ncbi:hypothetical protein [Thioflexithrix psekupsensis]|uniref:Uncharacterized protein n=1 Tax=Thioflexithrix psekupsensis TaxID=1570016 RepID=A0A251X5Z7_9GAMM|nr:hypothetical protein [Thioflexithrix psekupsensis]OUD13165.1 hypothetical protein TPSD3_11020 [Thioflexithrix psekupsensis]
MIIRYLGVGLLALLIAGCGGGNESKSAQISTQSSGTVNRDAPVSESEPVKENTESEAPADTDTSAPVVSTEASASTPEATSETAPEAAPETASEATPDNAAETTETISTADSAPAAATETPVPPVSETEAVPSAETEVVEDTVTEPAPVIKANQLPITLKYYDVFTANQVIALTIQLRNILEKNISEFDGELEIKDNNGQSLARLMLQSNDIQGLRNVASRYQLAQNAEKTWGVSIAKSQFDALYQHLASNRSLNELQAQFSVTYVRYSDGTEVKF